MACVLTGSVFLPSRLMMNPSYSVSSLWNSHLEGFTFIPDFRIASRMFLTSCWCCRKLSENMSTSSRYTMQHMSMYSMRVSLIHRWNAAGALHSPNGMTLYSYVPTLVENAVLYLSPSLICML